MAFTLDLGETAPDFSLPGTDGKNYSLANFADQAVLVMVFSCNHCPFVTGSEERMIAFSAGYAAKGRGVRLDQLERNRRPPDRFDGAHAAPRGGFELPIPVPARR